MFSTGTAKRVRATVIGQMYPRGVGAKLERPSKFDQGVHPSIACKNLRNPCVVGVPLHDKMSRLLRYPSLRPDTSQPSPRRHRAELESQREDGPYSNSIMRDRTEFPPSVPRREATINGVDDLGLFQA